MSTLIPLGALLDAVETDESNRSLLRRLEADELEVLSVLPKAERVAAPADSTLLIPVVIPPGESGRAVVVLNSMRVQSKLRLEGTLGSDETPFWASVEIPDDETDEVTVTPVTALGYRSDYSFGVMVSMNGLTLTINTQTPMTAGDLTLESVASFTAPLSARLEQAVIDLVKVGLEYEGLTSERSGDYTRHVQEYHKERSRILSRVLLSGSTSILT